MYMTLDQLSDHIRATPERVRRMLEVNRAAGPMFVNDVHRLFEAEKDPMGKSWEPLDEDTLDRKVNKSRRRGDGGKILQVTGRMRRSVSFSASPTRIVIGATPIYSRTHQEGRGNIPQRAFLGFLRPSVDRWLKAVFSYVVKGEKEIRFE